MISILHFTFLYTWNSWYSISKSCMWSNSKNCYLPSSPTVSSACVSWSWSNFSKFLSNSTRSRPPVREFVSRSDPNSLQEFVGVPAREIVPRGFEHFRMTRGEFRGEFLGEFLTEPTGCRGIEGRLEDPSTDTVPCLFGNLKKGKKVLTISVRWLRVKFFLDQRLTLAKMVDC